MRNGTISFGIISLLVFSFFSCQIILEVPIISGDQFNDPIYIEGNENFTAANGVLSGNGTEAKPYIITGLEISAESTHGIVVQNSDAYFIIKNASVQAGGENFFGIYLKNVKNATIENCVLDNNYYGIYIKDSNSIFIKDSNILNNKLGIYLESSRHCEIIGNNVSSSILNGILVEFSSNLVIKDNDIVSNHQVGIKIMSSSNNNIENNYITSNLSDGIYLYMSSDNEITDNLVLSNKERGIGIKLSTNCIMINNNVESNSWEGIYLESSDSGKLEKNKIRSNKMDGISFKSTSFCTISNCIVTQNIGNGIDFKSYSDSNVIINNNLTSNQEAGIEFSSAQNNTIENNSVSYNNKFGVYLQSSSDLNIINLNSISYNYYGIYIMSSSNNWIYCNNFVENTREVMVIGGTNKWNGTYPSGGNYWSSYIWEDQFKGANQDVAGQDGVYDEPYGINVNNMDYYPQKIQHGLGPIYAPQNVRTNEGDSHVILQWDKPVETGGYDITHYRIFKSKKADQIYFYKEIDDTQYYNDTDVTNGATYYYRISAKNFAGEGLLTDIITATPGTVPSPPANVSTISGKKHINLSWSEPENDGGMPVLNYTIYKRSATNEMISTVKIGNLLFYNDTDALKGETYFYKITALNKFGEGAFSTEVIGFTSLLPNQIPTASINANITKGSPPLMVYFMGLGADTDGTIVSYKWDFGDGSTSEEQNPTHTYRSLGTFPVTLTVKDDDGAENTAQIIISVSEGDQSVDGDLDGIEAEEKEGTDDDMLWLTLMGSAIILIIFAIIFWIAFVVKKKPAKKKKIKRIRKIIRKRRVPMPKVVEGLELKPELPAAVGESPEEAPMESPPEGPIEGEIEKHEEELEEVAEKAIEEEAVEEGEEKLGDELEVALPEDLPEQKEVPEPEIPAEKPVEEDIFEELDKKLILGEITEEEYKRLMEKKVAGETESETEE
ncbi:MAG: right-handed parallel beta-helix repeat-containing protein [Thermoplasmata archaeon]|nr:MAG: right-handed parallel beta-helix repeat-containing protein [Thermoplasmata archaeon]